MSKELKITEEKVLEAADKCSTAKEILRTLFPDVFTLKSPCCKDFGLHVVDGYRTDGYIGRLKGYSVLKDNYVLNLKNVDTKKEGQVNIFYCPFCGKKI